MIVSFFFVDGINKTIMIGSFLKTDFGAPRDVFSSSIKHFEGHRKCPQVYFRLLPKPNPDLLSLRLLRFGVPRREKISSGWMHRRETSGASEGRISKEHTRVGIESIQRETVTRDSCLEWPEICSRLYLCAWIVWICVDEDKTVTRTVTAPVNIFILLYPTKKRRRSYLTDANNLQLRKSDVWTYAPRWSR